MAKTICRLDNGDAVRYSAAFPLNSTVRISKQLKFMGVGIIIQVGDKRYNGTTRLKFYTTIKRVKKHGYKK